jgi:hypothetical protein
VESRRAHLGRGSDVCGPPRRLKGAAREPYVNHLIEEGRRWTREDAICADLLHDAIENQGISAEWPVAAATGRTIRFRGVVVPQGARGSSSMGTCNP